MANDKNNLAVKRAFVAGLRVAEMSYEDIGGIMGLSPRTVKGYWNQVKREELKVEGTKLIKDDAMIQDLLKKQTVYKSSPSSVKGKSPATKSNKQGAKTDKSEAPSGDDDDDDEDEEDVEYQH